MNKNKVYVGIFMLILGVILLFFEQSNDMAPLVIGFGAGVILAGLNGWYYENW